MAQFKYDAKTKTGYVNLNGHSKPKDVVKTIEVNHAQVMVNLDDNGMHLGMEILNMGCLGNRSFEMGE